MLATLFENELTMKLWDNPHPPAFKFQQYRSVVNDGSLPYEALAILKNPDGSSLSNEIFFDTLRDMSEEEQIGVDRYLVPLAIEYAAQKKRLPVAVNVHVASLVDPDFLHAVGAMMLKYNLNRRQVLFEIVEPHVPSPTQLEQVKALSSRHNEDGYVLVLDDNDFSHGHERLALLAPMCEMVKFDLDSAHDGYSFIKNSYPHLKIVLERVTFNDRDDVFARYADVYVQGI